MLKQQFVNILNTFEPITLGEMDSVKLMNRVDTKFAFSASDLKRLLPELIEGYKVFEIKDTRIPSYESLYFDDDDFTFFNDHHNGRMNRFKVRFRNYVESNLYFLEIKHKFKGRTDKERILVEGFPDLLTQKHTDFIHGTLQSKIDLIPCLWNSFNRITLVGKNINERLTLDFNIQFKWDNEIQDFNNLIIAELKQERTDRSSPFFEIMKKEGIRPYRLSKYCLGSIEVHGGDKLKYNKFKKKLLKLKKINDAIN